MGYLFLISFFYTLNHRKKIEIKKDNPLLFISAYFATMDSEWAVYLLILTISYF